MIPYIEHRPWQVLKSKQLLSLGEWLSVRQEEVQLPNGRRIPTWFILEFPDWVNVIAITKDGRMVMEDQYRHALGKTGLEICAGVIEKGETPLQAAQRELSEETGYGGGTWQQFMVLSPNPTNHNNLSYTFLATGVQLQENGQHQEATEDIRVHLMLPEDVKQALEQGLIFQALHAAPLWKYFAENRV